MILIDFSAYLIVKLVQVFVFFFSVFTIFHLTFYRLNNEVETDISEMLNDIFGDCSGKV